MVNDRKDLYSLSVSFGTESTRTLSLIGDGQNGVALFRWEEFEVVSSIIPPYLDHLLGPKSTVELLPEPRTQPRFWERYYDGDPDAVRIFEGETRKIVGADDLI
jgi:hypothetical protein